MSGPEKRVVRAAIRSRTSRIPSSWYQIWSRVAWFLATPNQKSSVEVQ